MGVTMRLHYIRLAFILFAFSCIATSCSRAFPGDEYATLSMYSILNPGSQTGSSSSTPGVTIGGQTSIITSEAPTTQQFTVVLDSQPSASVSFNIISTDTSEGLVSLDNTTFTGSVNVIFTDQNWDVPQTVYVQGQSDGIGDGNITYSITLGTITSTDVDYSGLDPADVPALNTDVDGGAVGVVGIAVFPTIGLITTEAGGSDQFGVVLQSEPTANVTIPISSNLTTEGTVSTASLTFTPGSCPGTGNWCTVQTVTVTGVNDGVVDGDNSYLVQTGAAVSADTNYNTLDAADVGVTNLGNSPGVVVSPISGISVSESGTSATFSVFLTSKPTANVTIALSSDDTAEGTVSPSLLTFAPANYANPQTVTVTGVDDAVVDGNQTFNIVTGVTGSTDVDYNGAIDPDDVAITNVDDDTAGIYVNTGDGLVVTEAGTADTFTVVLNSAPLSPVTLSTISSPDTGEVTVSPSSLTFDNVCPGVQCWNTPQTVTVTGVDDILSDGTQSVIVDLGTVTTGDGGAYTVGMDPGNVTVMNLDNEAIGVVILNPSGSTTSEAGDTMTFQVALASQPGANVTIPSISTTDNTEGVPSPTSLTFTTSNWNIPQTVTVTGQWDDGDVLDVAYSIFIGSSTSSDALWDGISFGQIDLVNLDKYGLNTTYAAGNAQDGVMFDVYAINTVRVQGFDSSFGSTGTHTVAVYYITGGYSGREGAPTVWTFLGTANVNVTTANTRTRIPLPMDLTLTAGQTYGFYITVISGTTTMKYTNGLTEGALYTSDANLEFYEGIGLTFPFGTVFTPRIWNGTIYYQF